MFYLNRKEARLVVLQRIELISNFIKKIRKLFGRYIFSNFISKYFLDTKVIGQAYYNDMNEEFKKIEKYINSKNQNFLSIGSGLGGLELIIDKKIDVSSFSFIEKNYVSKKVKYGWDISNKEAYNDLNIQKKFLIKNGMDSSKLNIFDYDKDKLPSNKFDIIISLYSLDYHYDFNIYSKYLKKISHNKTKIIFDTIRFNYFQNVFDKVVVMSERTKNIHSSKRIICSKFLD